MIDGDRALAIQRRAMRDFVAMLGSSAPGSELHERDGVTAARVPGCPGRSIVNSVTFAEAGALLAMHDELAAFYDEAGVNAWTVWVPDFDRETVAGLEERGHAFDGEPCAMTLELSDWEGPEVGDLDWNAEASPDLLGPLNDLAYGIDPAVGIGRALVSPSAEHLRLYAARVGGEPACVLGTIDHGGEDLGFYFVATHPERRGRGLATRLMAAAITDARERGLATASLQASAMGRPVYERLGFDPHFKLEMHELRRQNGGGE